MSQAAVVTAVRSEIESLVIEPQGDLTVEQIVDLLNKHQCSISGDQIVQWAPPPYEGSSVLGKITARAQTEQQTWCLVPLPAAAPKAG